MGSKDSSTKSGKPVLVYWALHGRSDFCQAMLYAGGIPYDLDDATANTWPATKEDSPFGQVPYMTHEGVTISQGGAINRYCAKLAGIYPMDPLETAICDMYIEECMDIFSEIFKAKNAADKQSKLDQWKRIEQEFLPKHFDLLEKNLVKSGKKYLGGDSVNAADVAFFTVYNLYDIAKLDVEGAILKCPNLKAALEGTKTFGDMGNFPRRPGIYFTSDPDHDSF